MTQEEQIALNNGIAIGMASKGIIAVGGGITPPPEDHKRIGFLFSYSFLFYTYDMKDFSIVRQKQSMTYNALERLISPPAYYNGFFYLVTIYKKVFKSADGIHWEYVSAMTYTESSSIGVLVSCNNFCALCIGNSIYKTTDFITWETKTIANISPQYDSIRRCIYKDGLFILSTYRGSLFTSSDLVTWTKRADARDAGNPVALFHDGSNYIFSHYRSSYYTYFFKSQNGIDWVFTNALTEYTTALGFANGYYYAIIKNALKYSKDLITWTTISSSDSFSNIIVFDDVAYVTVSACRIYKITELNTIEYADSPIFDVDVFGEYILP